MNRLTTEKRAQVIGALVEGNSIRATVRMTGAAKNTVTKLLADVGLAAVSYQDHALRDLPCRNLQCDEIWSYCYAKQKNVPDEFRGQYGYGDVWTWTALCADTKLVPSWLVGERTIEDARAFLTDLERRLANRVRLTTDGNFAYLRAVDHAFKGGIDYAMLQKLYGPDPAEERRYSPAVCTGVEQRVIRGMPNPDKISTSYVERQNLTMRMGMRRFTRVTNAFSKKIENLVWAVSLHFLHYYFARVHSTLKTTPAVAAGVAGHVWTLRDIAELIEREPVPSNPN